MLTAMQGPTARFRMGSLIPVKTLRVEITAGPEAGRTLETEAEVLSVGTAEGNGLRLADETVSGFHLELTRGETGVIVEDLSSSNGTWFEGMRIERGVVPSGTVLEIGRTRLRITDGSGADVPAHVEAELDDLKGETAVMRRLMAQVTTAARSTVPVLVVGESGTGKELVAKALHDHGERAAGPFVTFDCSAVVPNLIASELFGHERGAFTGADRQHVGAFERAHGGTLFLDEIGELPAELQPQLLGALERKRFRRVGGRTETPVDVRVVSATNRDLRAEVNIGSFRLDLYYRLAVVVLRVPSLRERKDDIPLLVTHFLRESGYTGTLEAFLGREERSRLAAHRWPGNVRELRNFVEATLAMGESPELREQEGQSPASTSGHPSVMDMAYKDARHVILDAFEAKYLKHLLQVTEGNVSQAARQADMDRTYLIKLLQRHGLR